MKKGNLKILEKINFLLFIITIIGSSLTIFADSTKNKIEIISKNYSMNESFSEDDYNYSFKNLSIEYPLEISVVAPEGTSLKINGKVEQINTNISIPIKKIDKDEKLIIEIKKKDENKCKKYTFNMMPETFPNYHIIGESPYEGDYYIDTYTNPSYILKLNQRGEVIYYNSDYNKMMDFKKQITTTGEVRYTYHIQEVVPTLEVGYTAGSIVILDEKYQEINRIKLQESKKVSKSFPVENHDFILISDNHYILSAYMGKIVKNIPEGILKSEYGSRVVASVLQEIKDGKVVWEWDSTDYPEFYMASQEMNDYTNSVTKWADYVHFNSMQIDPKDGNLICSFRNLDSIIKINRNTGEIMWILGGQLDQFGLTTQQKFSRQHYARITPENTITIFDNGVNVGKSRVLEIGIDQINKKVMNYKEYSKDNQYSSWGGSATKLKEDVFLIGWGGRRAHEATMSEIDFANKEVIFELYFQGDGPSYRCVKIK